MTNKQKEVLDSLKEDAFEVVEYDLREFSFRDLSTRCQKDGSIFVGGMFCTELCSNFKGHEIEGESIRCSANNTEETEET